MPARSLVAGLIFATTVAAQSYPGMITTTNLPAVGSAFDRAGNVYFTGDSDLGISSTPGAAQTGSGGGRCFFNLSGIRPCPDAVIGKFDSSGRQLWATLIGGATTDSGSTIFVDSSAAVYAAGNTGGSFPTSARAAITNSVTSKTWAAKVTADGRAFLYATYLPAIFGSVNSIAVDAYGNAHIGVVTTDNRAAIVKLSADGSLILYLKVFGGPGSGSAPRLAIDGAGNLIVASTTSSPDFPVTTGVVQSHLAGFANVALTKLDPAGNIVFSTFFGGSGSDGVSSLQIDSAGSLYISGETTSLDFPTTPGTFAPQALVPTWGDFPGGFLAKLAPDATRIEFSTYLFSSSYGGSQIALGTAGDIFLAGVSGPGLPVRTSAPLPCLSQSVSQVGANFSPASIRQAA